MSEATQSTFGALLTRAREGDQSAFAGLFPLVYDQLRRLARAQRRKRPNETLNTTALVHEAYIRLAGAGPTDIRDHAHFMSVVVVAMRQVLIDHARARLTAKRGGGARTVSIHEIEAALESGPDFTDGKAEALLTVDDALSRLAKLSERQSKVVECRFYGGLSLEETAQALGISMATVRRDWTMAQAWLYRDLQDALV
jgi:RNA polymerase sigma factor (TIGR02999 family)